MTNGIDEVNLYCKNVFMKKLFFVLSLVVSFTSFAQGRAELFRAAVSNASASDTFMLRDSVLCYFTGDADSDSSFLYDLVREKFITNDDVVFMRSQLKNDQKTLWSKDSIAGAVIVSSAQCPSNALSAKKAAKAWKSYFKSHQKGFYEVGKPLFSKDGNSAVIYTSFQCGAKCGNGGATLFQKKNGKWVAVKHIYSWRK
jgi:hypothetical protein